MTGLGLTKYLPLFKKEEFDMSSISEIDEAVLNSLELPRGVRLTFLKARKEYLDQQVQEQKDKNKGTLSCSASLVTDLIDQHRLQVRLAFLIARRQELFSLPLTSSTIAISQ